MTPEFSVWLKWVNKFVDKHTLQIVFKSALHIQQ